MTPLLHDLIGLALLSILVLGAPVTAIWAFAMEGRP